MKAVQLQTESFGIQPIGLYSFVALIEFLRTDHVTAYPQGGELPLQSKSKPAHFINGVYLCSFLLELGRPIQESSFSETLRRLGISPTLLFDHHMIILAHINPELDDGSAPTKLEAGFLV